MIILNNTRKKIISFHNGSFSQHILKPGSCLMLLLFKAVAQSQIRQQPILVSACPFSKEGVAMPGERQVVFAKGDRALCLYLTLFLVYLTA